MCVVTVTIAHPAWAHANCQDFSTVWTLGGTQVIDGVQTATRVYSDGQAYTDRTTGVTAHIFCSNTFDAVLIVGSGRTIMLNLTAAYLLDSSYPPPPAWTANGAFASPPSPHFNCSGSPCTVLNVRNILDFGIAPRNQYYKLYTRLDSAFVAPDKNSYHLPMHNPTTSDVASNSNDAFVNSPFENARVVVQHYPAGQGPQECGTKECWVVEPETPLANGSLSPSPENATLLTNDKSVNYGQFSVPFHFTIAVK
jgi:hypothetical protein